MKPCPIPIDLIDQAVNSRRRARDSPATRDTNQGTHKFVPRVPVVATHAFKANGVAV